MELILIFLMLFRLPHQFQNVLTDWDDESCIKILQNCHKALPKSGRLILAEIMTAEDSNSYKSIEIVFDLVMIALANGGKERSTHELMKLLQLSNFNVVKIVELPGLSKLKIIEAIKV
ncbi:myricetin 3-O-methyltransferase 3-like [Cryptomeria japonica]|uniref:myricetin 3-O-methyltransferase 3-like n=1 Tax=Cryptomeria japonica TaxID=3369 RepID=UPI0025AD8B3C|nr:myricetin 3-O-methyltransferase 3-like [Cryptomeria japonica]